jgi:hypothetical protein
VSIVTKGAVDRKFAIYKSADFMGETDNSEIIDDTIIKDDDSMTKQDDKIEKSADELKVELQKALDEKAELEKAVAGIEKAKKEMSDKEKAAEDKEKEAAAKLKEAEDMEKSVADIKKAAEEDRKIAKDASERVARLEDIAKSETVKAEVRKSMSGVAGVTSDELASVIKTLDERQLKKEEIETLVKALKASSALIEKSALFKELGSSRGDEPNDPQSMCDAYVNGLVAKADHTMTTDERRAASADFWDSHQDLYKAYLNGGRS